MKRFKKGITMLELLVVIGLILIVVAGILVYLNPVNQLARGRDARRKNELNELRKIFEEYFSDKYFYPNTSICMPGTASQVRVNGALIAYKCNLCLKTNNPTLYSFVSPYSTQEFCDSEYPSKTYLYYFDPSSGGSIPRWYIIFSENTADYVKELDPVNCGPKGCGPAPDYNGYDYYVSSPNVPQTAKVSSEEWICYNDGSCSNAGITYDVAINNPYCVDKDKIYSSRRACCSGNVTPQGAYPVGCNGLF